MNVILNLCLAALGLAGALAAFGGDAWRKGNARLIKRITLRGWASLICLVLAFVVGVIKEVCDHRQDIELATAKARTDTKYQALLKDLGTQIAQLQIAISQANQAGVQVHSVPADISSPRVLVQEAMNFAVSVSLSAEEQFTRENWKLALNRFQQADAVADVAAIKARIADTYVRLGDYENAVKYEAEAIELAPDWNGPPYVLAFSLLKLGRPAEALPHAERSCHSGFDGACNLVREIRTSMLNARE